MKKKDRPRPGRPCSKGDKEIQLRREEEQEARRKREERNDSLKGSGPDTMEGGREGGGAKPLTLHTSITQTFLSFLLHKREEKTSYTYILMRYTLIYL